MATSANRYLDIIATSTNMACKKGIWILWQQLQKGFWIVWQHEPTWLVRRYLDIMATSANRYLDIMATSANMADVAIIPRFLLTRLIIYMNIVDTRI